MAARPATELRSELPLSITRTVVHPSHGLLLVVAHRLGAGGVGDLVRVIGQARLDRAWARAQADHHGLEAAAAHRPCAELEAPPR